MLSDATGSLNLQEIVDRGEIEALLSRPSPSDTEVEEALACARSKQALSLEQTANLLGANTPAQNDTILKSARALKEAVYGNRVVLFAPLYIGSYCINDCSYCAFRSSNKDVVRHHLGAGEIETEVRALQAQGHKRLVLVFGEHPRYDADAIARAVEHVYTIEEGRGAIRRVNINAAPLTIEGFARVHEAGIGTYQIFQETYHQPTYERYHTGRGPKSDYEGRLRSLDHAQQAGVDDVGIGALFGLYDWRFEVLGLVSHARHLQRHFGVGPHTISFPRLRPAHGVTPDPRYVVTDEQLERIVAVLRLAVPYAGMILTAREEAPVRRRLLELGVSQIDGGTRIDLGGYSTDLPLSGKTPQFELGDTRSLSEIIEELCETGYLPSFCTACYSAGRTGEHFMEFAVPGFIKRFCTPNALFTLREYLDDYGSERAKVLGADLIASELKGMSAEHGEKARAALRTISDEDRRDVRW